MSPFGKFSSETDPAVARLRARLDAFYDTTTEYSAFLDRSWRPKHWTFLLDAIRESKARPCQVLEFGAGRSGFSEYLASLRIDVGLTVQDVTPANETFLRQQADNLYIGPLESMEGQYDVIFSSFVLEHVTNPRATLEACWRMLKPGGKLFIFCPRYDAPFYLPPSADHYRRARRLLLGCWLLLLRLLALLRRQPRFLIHTDPALFHLKPWARDQDAIHWVSMIDLKLFFRRRGILRKLRVPSGSLRDWILKNLLQVNICITKPAG